MALSPIKSRVVSAIRGAFVADAASMGTHWVYDPKEMLQLVKSSDEPEFTTPPTPKFYSAEEFPGHYGAGMLSPYGEQLLFVTEYVAGASSVTGAGMSGQMLKWAESFGGRPDSAIKTFIDNMKKEDGTGQWPNCGADDDQAHVFMKIVPVTCLLAGKPELIDTVTEIVRVHQNNDMAVAFGVAAARILEAVLLGGDLKEALATCLANLGTDDFPEKDIVMSSLKRGINSLTQFKDLDALLLELSHEKMKDNTDSPFYDLAARSCALPGSFIGPIYLLNKLSSGSLEADGWYAAGLRENIIASGDTCSRAVLIGAILAAAADSVPEAWIQKLDKVTLDKVNKAANAIAGKS